MAASLRRKLAVVLALAVGFGVVSGTDPASAAGKGTTSTHSTHGKTTLGPLDWWW